jgi:hypothetical protein
VTAPTISAIIPARNEEAAITRAVESVAAQPEVREVIVVDDYSTDRTPEILDELATRLAKVRIVKSGDLPDGGLPTGWTGKNNAVWLGAQHASGEWLLFTDADTHHLSGSAARALSDAVRMDADFVSYSPEQETRIFAERALVPLVLWRLSHRYSFDRVNNSACRDAAANGQYILVSRSAYRAIGGHASVAGEVVEDVALARRAKESGFRVFFAPGQGIVETRMYQSFAAMWEGWTKNLYPLFGGSVSDMLLEIDAATPIVGFVFAALLGVQWATARHFDWLVAIVAAVFFVRPWGWYDQWLARNQYPSSYIRYYLVGSALFTGAMVASWWKNTHGAVAWKGRRYDARLAPAPQASSASTGRKF